MQSERAVSFDQHDTTETAELARALAQAEATIRDLRRQLNKSEARYDEAIRAHRLMVANLSEATRECAMLERELDQWKQRAASGGQPLSLDGVTLSLTPTEVGAIRKAMARLHHPDRGGDPERMKQWNAALDPLDS